MLNHIVTGFVNFDKTSYVVRLNQADSAETVAGLKALRFWAGDLQFKQSDVDSVRPELTERSTHWHKFNEAIGQ